MKKIIITGCAGFIGSQLAKILVKKNKVFGIDDLSYGNVKKNPFHKNFFFIKGSCENKKILNKIKGKIDYIYHLAGQSSGEKSFYNPYIDFEKNSLTTIRLLELAIKKKCKRFIYASSMSVYGNLKVGRENAICDPISFYGLSKITSENYIKKFKKKGLNYTICRLFNVFGKSQELNNFQQGMLRIYLSQLSKKNNLIIKGNKNRFRDFINVKDVVSMLSKIPNISQSKNEIINIGTGKKTLIRNLLKLLKKNINKEFTISFKKGTPDDQHGIISSTNKMKRIFGSSIKYSGLSDIEKVIKNSNL